MLRLRDGHGAVSFPQGDRELFEGALLLPADGAALNVGGELGTAGFGEVVVPAGSIVKFPRNVLHDVRNLGPERCVIMFVKVNPKILRGSADG